MRYIDSIRGKTRLYRTSTGLLRTGRCRRHDSFIESTGVGADTMAHKHIENTSPIISVMYNVYKYILYIFISIYNYK